MAYVKGRNALDKDKIAGSFSIRYGRRFKEKNSINRLNGQ